MRDETKPGLREAEPDLCEWCNRKTTLRAFKPPYYYDLTPRCSFHGGLTAEERAERSKR